MPDYHLYDGWVNEQLKNGGKWQDFKYYLDYSIGFLSRGCFRQCEFCVNKNYTKVNVHSPLSEFFDESRKKICLLDDNFLGCAKWKELLLEIQATGRRFQFKQGLDERILTDESCWVLFGSKYDGDFIFAFDDIADKEIIETKAYLIQKYRRSRGQIVKFYVLCAFDRSGKYDAEFWKQDIRDIFKRVFLLAKFSFRPYIMRYEKYKESPLYGVYVSLARWCNQPSLFAVLSFSQFCQKDDLYNGGKKQSSTWRYYEQLVGLGTEFKEYADTVPRLIK